MEMQGIRTASTSEGPVKIVASIAFSLAFPPGVPFLVLLKD